MTMGRHAEDRRDVTEVAVGGRGLVLVEDTSTDDQDGVPKSIRRWAPDARSEVVVTTMTTSASQPTATVVQEAALGMVMVRGMERGTPRDELTTAVRQAATAVPDERRDVVAVDGAPVRALMVDVDGCTVAGLVDGATTVVVTASGPGPSAVRLSA